MFLFFEFEDLIVERQRGYFLSESLFSQFVRVENVEVLGDLLAEEVKTTVAVLSNQVVSLVVFVDEFS